MSQTAKIDILRLVQVGKVKGPLDQTISCVPGLKVRIGNVTSNPSNKAKHGQSVIVQDKVAKSDGTGPIIFSISQHQDEGEVVQHG